MRVIHCEWVHCMIGKLNGQLNERSRRNARAICCVHRHDRAVPAVVVDPGDLEAPWAAVSADRQVAASAQRMKRRSSFRLTRLVLLLAKVSLLVA